MPDGLLVPLLDSESKREDDETNVSDTSQLHSSETKGRLDSPVLYELLREKTLSNQQLPPDNYHNYDSQAKVLLQLKLKSISLN